ncbi:MAG: biopolymer transporter ExbD [Pseudomonadota bacterium]
MAIRRRRWRERHAQDTAELNITAFMNLMVILVPFLLITAVFSRLAVLELNLPGPDGASAETQEEEPLQLEITVRANYLEVGDRNTGLLQAFANAANGEYDLVGLADFLKQVKVRYPDKTDATVLLEPDIEYDVLVQVMDAVRVEEVVNDDGTKEFGELFPEIAVGDAVAASPGVEAALTADAGPAPDAGD